MWTDRLIVNGEAFPVEKATFSMDGEELVVEVDCGRPTLSEEHSWRHREPKLHSEGALLPGQDGEAELIRISDPRSLDDVPPFSLYMFEHEPVVSCTGTLHRDADGHRLELTGCAEVMGKVVPFSLSTAIARED